MKPEDYGSFYLSNATFARLDGRGARSWIYQSCTEFSYFQTCSDKTMRSSLLTISFYEAWCEDIFGKGVWAMTERVNTEFGGLDFHANNTYMVNGDEDPWRWASLQTSRDNIVSKVAVCEDCGHCPDFRLTNTASSLVKIRQDEETAISNWISAHWKSTHSTSPRQIVTAEQ